MRLSLLFLCATLLAGCPRAPATLPAVVHQEARSELVGGGSLRSRLAPADDAELVIFFGGEQAGSLEPCGCDEPRGSLYRVESYVQASRQRQPTPTLLVNVGHWLDDSIDARERPTAQAQSANPWMLRGLEAGGWDVLNLAAQDLPWLLHAGDRPSEAVSANLRPEDPDATWPPRWRHLRSGQVDVVITGVTGDSLAWTIPTGWSTEDPVQAVQTVLAEVEADLVVVLAYDVDGRAEELAALEGVDILIEGDGYLERYPPVIQDSTLWVRSHHQTRRLGELRLRMARGRITASLERRVDMDSAIPAGPRTGPLAEQALAAIQSADQCEVSP